MPFHCCDCHQPFASLQALKSHAGEGAQQKAYGGGRPGQSEAEQQAGCSGLYYKGTSGARVGRATTDADMDREGGQGLDAPDPPPDEPGLYHEGRRVEFVKRADNLKLTCVEYFISRAVLKLPALLGATVVKIVWFMRCVRSPFVVQRKRACST